VTLNSVESLVGAAETHFLKGEYAPALEALTKALAVNKNHSKANELRGYISGNQHQILEAIHYLKIATEAADCSLSAFYELGSLLLLAENSIDAIPYFHKALEIENSFFEARYQLGLALAKCNRLDEALANFNTASFLNPTSAEVLFNIARIYDEKKEYKNSLSFYNEALDLNSNFIDALVNKGITLKELGNYEEAIECYDRVILLTPDHAQAWSNRGNALSKLKRDLEAIGSYDNALKINGRYAEALSNKSNALIELRQYNLAVNIANEAIALDRMLMGAWLNKATALKKLRHYEDAVQCMHQFILLKWDVPEVYICMGDILTELKRYEEALSAYQQALTLDPEKDYLYGLSVYIKTMLCDWSHYGQQLLHIQTKLTQDKKVAVPFSLLALLDDEGAHLKAAKLFASDKFPESAILGPIPKRASAGKIRLGYFSADFKNHPVASLIAELFELHDRNQFEIIGFSLGSDDADDMRLRLKESFDQFIDIHNQSDQGAAQLARDLKIDIAIDLGGYTQDCRTGIFAYRAAPIQVNYLGYPGTMGAPYIDYIIADDTVIPEANQQYYSEKVAYLPHTYQANDRKRKIADQSFKRADFDLPEQVFIFCCFNNNFKLTPSTLDSWARILKAVNGSVLWLYEGNEKTKLNLIKEFANRDLAPERLIFAKRVPPDEHLARYQLADLFIDTLPYNAHTTTSDALWAGTPVLTLTGNSFAGRVATSLLEAIEMPELITNTLQEYEDKAIDLAKNPHELVQLKKKLQAKRDTTPLFNTPLFTKHIEAAYIAMYQRYQQDLGPEALRVDG